MDLDPSLLACNGDVDSTIDDWYFLNQANNNVFHSAVAFVLSISDRDRYHCRFRRVERTTVCSAFILIPLASLVATTLNNYASSK